MDKKPCDGGCGKLVNDYPRAVVKCESCVMKETEHLRNAPPPSKALVFFNCCKCKAPINADNFDDPCPDDGCFHRE